MRVAYVARCGNCSDVFAAPSVGGLIYEWRDHCTGHHTANPWQWHMPTVREVDL